MLAVPFRIGFEVESAGPGYFIDNLTNVLFALDIIFNCFTAEYLNGDLLVDICSITRYKNTKIFISCATLCNSASYTLISMLET